MKRVDKEYVNMYCIFVLTGACHGIRIYQDINLFLAQCHQFMK